MNRYVACVDLLAFLGTAAIVIRLWVKRKSLR